MTMLLDHGMRLHLDEGQHHLLAASRVDIHARKDPVMGARALIDERLEHGRADFCGRGIHNGKQGLKLSPLRLVFSVARTVISSRRGSTRESALPLGFP